MKKYVLVGTGGRGYFMYAEAIAQRYTDVAVLSGVMDINHKRAEYVSKRLKNEFGMDVLVFTDFDEMMNSINPDCVIVTTVDKYHHIYINKALDFGADVISEKPMTIDAQKCIEILESEKRNNRRIAVTFNCRYMPIFEKIKEILDKSEIGEILNVDFEWMLDTNHGADYFRRWHRYLDNSGGLLVHKSTHHFDIINWLIGQTPVEVYANGRLGFYGANRSKKGERCSSCCYTDSCEYVFQDNNIEWVRDMYFNCEDEHHYFRDRCIFDEDIDIYDMMSLAVRYDKGALMSYSLIAYSPYEGWKMNITGTNGRLEATEYHSGLYAQDPLCHIYIYNRKGDCISYNFKKGTGNHGGGDEKLLQMLFYENLPDPLGQCAGSKDGAKSLLIGAAANISIQEHRPVLIESLVPASYLK